MCADERARDVYQAPGVVGVMVWVSPLRMDSRVDVTLRRLYFVCMGNQEPSLTLFELARGVLLMAVILLFVVAASIQIDTWLAR